MFVHLWGGAGGRRGGGISGREWWMQGEQGVASQNAVSPKWEKDIVQDFWAQKPRGEKKKKSQVVFHDAMGNIDNRFVYWSLPVWNLRITPLLLFTMPPALQIPLSSHISLFSFVTLSSIFLWTSLNHHLNIWVSLYQQACFLLLFISI